MIDEDPSSCGLVCWRDQGAARGRLYFSAVVGDSRDADDLVTRWTTAKHFARMHRRETRADGAHLVYYVVVVRERKNNE